MDAANLSRQKFLLLGNLAISRTNLANRIAATWISCNLIGSFRNLPSYLSTYELGNSAGAPDFLVGKKGYASFDLFYYYLECLVIIMSFYHFIL